MATVQGNGQGTSAPHATTGGWSVSPVAERLASEHRDEVEGEAEASTRRRRGPRPLRALLDILPQGNTLSDEDFKRRHLFLCWVLGLHIPALFVFGVIRGYAVGSTALEMATPLFCLIFARVVRNRRLAGFFVTAGLVFCSSVLVHLSGGVIEAHFHFFILIGLIALYQDWLPFLWNTGFTVLSHGLGSAMASNSMFNHHAAQDHPWTWAGIHGVSVLAASVGVIIFWRSTEIEQERSRTLALELASSQVAAAQFEANQRQSVSELFVNLARRNQSLLDRQLELIAELEQRERRPEELAELFKLDHLATRIRRNAESLLVLSGDDPPRRWGRPVPLGDVVRAAAAEVEDYRRVEVLVNDHLEVVGRAVADLAHLLAELIENATTFSPPGSEVRVRSHLLPGEHAGFVLSIEDTGIGMSEGDMASANQLLAEPPDVDLRRSRLGFHVVSRLAKRYGLKANLASTPGGGVTAMVMLPYDLVSERRLAVPATSGPTPDLDVYALPERAIASASPQGWQAAPTMPGVDPPPADAWQAPPPISPVAPLVAQAREVLSRPRETWEIAPASGTPVTATRPMMRPRNPFQPPPPIDDPDPSSAPAAVPAHAPAPEITEAPAARATPDLDDLASELPGAWSPPPSVAPAPAPSAPAGTNGGPDLPTRVPGASGSGDAWRPVGGVPPVPEARVTPEPDVAEPTAPTPPPAPAAEPAAAEAVPAVDAPVPVAEEPPASAAEVGTEPKKLEDKAEGAEALAEAPSAEEAAPAGESEATEAKVEQAPVEAAVETTEAPAEAEAGVEAPSAEAEAASEVEPEAKGERVEAEIVAEQPREPLPSRPVSPARLVPPIARPPRDMREPRQAPPAGQPAPFVPEVPVAGEFPPPLDRPVTPAAGAGMGIDHDGTLDRPMFTNWPPSLRTEADSQVTPPYLAGPAPVPPGGHGGPPAPQRPPGFEPPLRAEHLGQPNLAYRQGLPAPGDPGRPPGPGGAPSPDAAPEFTADGLVKRVPGARLAAGLQSSRSRNNGGVPDGFESPVPDARRQQASSALSRFQAAQRDGRAAAAEGPTDPPEEQEPS